MLAAKSRATIGAGASTSANTTRCSRLSSASILTCRACSQIFGQKRDCSQSILRHPREVLSHCLIDNTSSKMWVCSSECRLLVFVQPGVLKSPSSTTPTHATYITHALLQLLIPLCCNITLLMSI